jgi:hypothetical protein
MIENVDSKISLAERCCIAEVYALSGLVNNGRYKLKMESAARKCLGDDFEGHIVRILKTIEVSEVPARHLLGYSVLIIMEADTSLTMACASALRNRLNALGSLKC